MKLSKLLSPLLVGTVFLSQSALATVEENTKETEKWTVIHAGTLLAVPGEGPKSEQSIFIKNNKIDHIEAGYKTPKSNENTVVKIVDLKNSFVMPGMLDMHVHLDLDRSLNLSRKSEDERRSIGVITAIKNAETTLNAGYTTVRNPGGDGYSVKAVRDAIKQGRVIGPRVYTAAHTITASADKDYSGACSGVEGCRKAVRRQIEQGADFIKVYATCSGSQPCGHGDARPVFLDDELKAIIDTAKSRQLKVAAHAHAVAGIHQVLKAGVDSVEHATFSDNAAYPLYIANNVYMVPTIAVQDNVIADRAKTTDPDMLHVMDNAINSHPKAVRGAYKAGVKIAAGSDAGVVKHGENANELLWYVNKVGMTPMEALVTTTINGAALLGRADDLGTIEAGKLADIIALKASPLEKIEAIKNVSFVMKNGEIYKNEH